MKISDHANPKCPECDGEGFCCYDDGHGDGEDLPCQVCFPPAKNQLQTNWEDFEDPDRDDGFD